MQSLGQQIRARRRAIGMTLEGVCGLAGCTKGYLSSIETGKRERPPSAELLGRLETALGFADGELVARGGWERAPAEMRRRVVGLERRVEEAARLAEMVLERAAGDGVWCGVRS